MIWRRRARIRADHGGIAAARDIFIGIPLEQVQALIRQANEPLQHINREQQANLGRLQVTLGQTKEVIRRVLQIVGASDTPEGLENEKVIEVALTHRALLHEQHDDAAPQTQIDLQVRRALEQADFDQADKLLAKEIARHERALVELGSSTASLYRRRAAIAQAQLQYSEAVSLFRLAIQQLPVESTTDRRAYTLELANCLFIQGTTFKDRDRLIAAVPLWNELLDTCSDVHQIERTNLQLRLANTLREVGQLDVGTDILKQSTDVYLQTLGSLDRQVDPLSWAGIQNSLGIAWMRIGEREPSMQTLQKALAAFDDSVVEFERHNRPNDWTGIQNNRGVVLRMIGDKQIDDRHLRESQDALEGALKRTTRESNASLWAMMNDNLGVTLSLLGMRADDLSLLELSIQAFRLALTVFSKGREPLQWANTKHNLGHALYHLSLLKNDTNRLREAIDELRAALVERQRSRVPLEWAETHINLGRCLFRMAEVAGSSDKEKYLREAVQSYEQSLEVVTAEKALLTWSKVQSDLGVAFSELAVSLKSQTVFAKSQTCFDSALQKVTRLNHPYDWALLKLNAGFSLINGDKVASRRKFLMRSIQFSEQSLLELRKETNLGDFYTAKQNIAIASTTMGLRESGTESLKKAREAWLCCLDISIQTGPTARTQWIEDNLSTVQDTLNTRLM